MSRCRRINFWRAVRHFACWSETLLVVFGGIVEIAQDDEILPAIAIVIEERRSGTPASRQSDAGVLRRDISKRAVAEIAIQTVSAIAGNKDIDAAVVIE